MRDAAKSELSAIWPKLREILLPYEGSASQLYIFDVPLPELTRVLSEFCARSVRSRVSTLNGQGVAPSDQRVCDAASVAQIAGASAFSIVLGQFAADRQIQLWIWPDIERWQFDAELVFFADEFFPIKTDELANLDSFSLVYEIADRIRANSPRSERALSGSEVGDPRAERDKPWVVFW